VGTVDRAHAGAVDESEVGEIHDDDCRGRARERTIEGLRVRQIELAINVQDVVPVDRLQIDPDQGIRIQARTSS
jgi:hypothetical protein